MKKGEFLPLYVGNVQVGSAEIIEIATDRITVETPALRAVIGVRMELTDESAPREEPSKETIITGVDRPGNIEAPVTAEDIPAATEPVSAPPAAPVEPVPTPPGPAPVAEGAAVESQATGNEE